MFCCKLKFLPESPQSDFFCWIWYFTWTAKICCIGILEFTSITQKCWVGNLKVYLNRWNVFRIWNLTFFAQTWSVENLKVQLNHPRVLCIKFEILTESPKTKSVCWKFENLPASPKDIFSEIRNFASIAQKYCLGNLNIYLNRSKMFCLKLDQIAQTCCVGNFKFYPNRSKALNWKFGILPESSESGVCIGSWKFNLIRQNVLRWNFEIEPKSQKKWCLWNWTSYLNRSKVLCLKFEILPESPRVLCLNVEILNLNRLLEIAKKSKSKVGADCAYMTSYIRKNRQEK